MSPRAGVVYKPIAPLSVYGSYSVSYLPSSGDQFSSLTTITQQVEPERFNNYEIGAKWDVRPTLAVTTAVYRLDRTNTRSTDPNDPTRIVQTGSQRTNGFEAGVNGQVTPRWKIAGGYAFQDAFVTSATTAAPERDRRPGAAPHLLRVEQLPGAPARFRGARHHSALRHVRDDQRHRDAAGLRPGGRGRLRHADEGPALQVNLENAFDKRYFVNADSNTSISPGTPRTLRVGLTAGF